MQVTYVFDRVVIRREIKTFCQVCRKKLKRVLSDGYCRNGMHDEVATRAKINKYLDKQVKVVAKKGVLCKSCEETAEQRKKGGWRGQPGDV